MKSNYQWPSPDSLEERPIYARELDITMLPEAIREWVDDESYRMSCPLDFVAIPAIILAGTLIGSRCMVQPKMYDSGWRIPANLWGGVIGDPGQKKSPAQSAAFKPLKRLEREIEEAHRVEAHKNKAAEERHKIEIDSIRGEMKAAYKRKSEVELSQLEAQMAAKMPPDPLPHKRFYSSDSTIEKLGDLLQQNPNGLLVLRDELIGLLSMFDREGHEQDRAFYLEAWNGKGSFTVDRIGRGTVVVKNMCLSIFGTTQPDKLQKYIYRATTLLENDGLLQRFQLLVYPDTLRPEFRDEAPNADAYQRAEHIYEQLANGNPAHWGATPTGIDGEYYFQFDSDAYDEFRRWEEELSQMIEEEERPIIKEHFSKYSSLMPKLAMIYHIIDSIDKGSIGAISHHASCVAVEFCRYLATHARKIYAHGLNAEVRAAQNIRTKILDRKLCSGFTVRDIRQKGWSLLQDNKAIESALQLLEDANMVRKIPSLEGAAGRHTERYEISPYLLPKPDPEGNDGDYF